MDEKIIIDMRNITISKGNIIINSKKLINEALIYIGYISNQYKSFPCNVEIKYDINYLNKFITNEVNKTLRLERKNKNLIRENNVLRNKIKENNIVSI